MRFISVLVAFLCVLRLDAAVFSTSIAQPIGTSWNDPIWNPGPTVATAGNTYEVLATGLVRNPTVVSSTFPGDALQLDGNSILRMKPPADGITTTVNFPGVKGAPGLILNGGGIDPGSANTTFVVGGKINVAAASFLLGPTVDTNRNVIITASLGGSGSITVQNFLNNSGVSVQSVSNEFSGNWIVTGGRLSGIGANSLGSGGFNIAAGSSLQIHYAIETPGALTLNGVMTLTTDCQFSGATINGTNLTAGTHSYSDLQARFPRNFAGNGSGSITIIPPEVTLSIVRDSNGLTVQFVSAAGHAYTVESATNLTQPIVWSNTAPSINGDGALKSVLVAPDGESIFIRLRVD